MRKLIENFLWAGAFLLTLQSAWGFSLAGPIANNDDNWQTIDIGYGFNDPVAPKDIYEEYRPVVPVMYYASDASFISYFGSSGLTNIDAAFAILNGVMCGQTNTPVYLYSPTNGVTMSANGAIGGTILTLGSSNSLDSYNPSLSDFSFDSMQYNYTAQALGLLDIKTYVLHSVVLQLGLADPDRYVWALHNRLVNPLGLQNPLCPQDVEYTVVQRNFDVSQSPPYSSLINGSLYTYFIKENCGFDPAVPWSARTFPEPADPFATRYSAVTSGGLLRPFALQFGSFYTGLTWDDVAGLRYLLSTNNINWEATAPSGGVLLSTNVGAQQLLITSNLTTLVTASMTNDPVTLAAMFPGLSVVGLATNYSLGWITNYTAYYTNYIGSPYGTPPQLVYATSVTPTLVTTYVNAFLNVVTNHYYPNTVNQIMSVTVTNAIGAPYGSPLVTYVTYQTVVLTNVSSGDYYLVPANSAGYKINSVILTNPVITTNVIVSALSSSNSYSFTQSIVNYSTNYWMLVQPLNVSSTTPVPALRRGVGRVQFISASYDSILGQFFQPLTNNYSMVMITNSQPITEYYQRVVTRPDFLFQAADLSVPNANFPFGQQEYTVTTPNFDQSTIINNLAGPGTIPPGANLTFNKTLNSLYVNGSLNNYNLSTNAFLNIDTQSVLDGFWASFDGSTNYPVVYPSTASIASLMNQIVIQVTPSTPPDATNGVPYTVTFQAAGGVGPYTWSGPNVSTTVPGLSFDVATATLSGTPVAVGTFNFTLQVTDSANRSVNLNYSITIH